MNYRPRSGSVQWFWFHPHELIIGKSVERARGRYQAGVNPRLYIMNV
jgi:hypothetical protein